MFKLQDNYEILWMRWRVYWKSLIYILAKSCLSLLGFWFKHFSWPNDLCEWLRKWEMKNISKEGFRSSWNFICRGTSSTVTWSLKCQSSAGADNQAITQKNVETSSHACTSFVYHNWYLCIKVLERCRMPKREH